MAENKRYYWLQLKENFFKQPRIKKLRRMAGGDTYTIIYLKMQLLSLQNGGKLVYEGIEDDFVNELALNIDEKEEDIQMTVMYLTQQGLLIEGKDDEFTLPSFNGLELTPPTWKPKDYHSKVVKVVYPILKKGNVVEYHISEREEVVHNLQAHITNNLSKNKSVTDERRNQLNALAATKTLEEILSCDELLPYISPAWKNAGSSEAMILRKMRNNAIKKISKEFKNAYQAEAYESTFDDYEQYESDERIKKEAAVDAEITIEAVSEAIDIDLPANEETPSKSENNVQSASMEPNKRDIEEISEQVEQPKTSSRRVKPY